MDHACFYPRGSLSHCTCPNGHLDQFGRFCRALGRDGPFHARAIAASSTLRAGCAVQTRRDTTTEGLTPYVVAQHACQHVHKHRWRQRERERELGLGEI